MESKTHRRPILKLIEETTSRHPWKLLKRASEIP